MSMHHHENSNICSAHTKNATHNYLSAEQMDDIQAWHHKQCNDSRYQTQEINNEGGFDKTMSSLTNHQKADSEKDCEDRYSDSNEGTLDFNSTKTPLLRPADKDGP